MSIIPVGVQKPRKRNIQDTEEVVQVPLTKQDKMQVQEQINEMVTDEEVLQFKEREGDIAEQMGVFDPRVQRLSQEVAKKKKQDSELDALLGLDPVLVNQMMRRLLGESKSNQELEKIEKEKERMEKEIMVPPPKKYREVLQKHEYVQIGYLARRLIEVFGVGSYVSDIKSEKKVEQGLIQGGYYVIFTMKMRVTITNAYIPSFYAEDVGTGVGRGQTLDKAYDTAYKSARTDAFKRCCKDFGPTFGSYLYSKIERENSRIETENPKIQNAKPK
jgi:hypothetical protein